MSDSTCVICGKRIPEEPRRDEPAPFCSERCRQIDLGRWLGERYRVSNPVPVAPDDPESV